MKLIFSLAALAVLSACADWSVENPTEQQRALARYICVGDEAALAAYVAARGRTAESVGIPAFGPERDLYCALRGYRVAGYPMK